MVDAFDWLGFQLQESASPVFATEVFYIVKLILIAEHGVYTYIYICYYVFDSVSYVN